MLLARASTLLMLLNAVMTILVVDLASLFVAEDLVGLGYLYELFACGVISTGSRQLTYTTVCVVVGLLDARVLVWMVLLAKTPVGFLDIAIGGTLLESQ